MGQTVTKTQEETIREDKDRKYIPRDKQGKANTKIRQEVETSETKKQAKQLETETLQKYD